MTQTGNYFKGLKLANQVFKDSQGLEDTLISIDTIISKANVLMTYGKLDECLEGIDICENLLNTVKHIKNIQLAERTASIGYIKGVVYRKKGDLDLALEHLEKCASIRQELGDLYGTADSFNIIGNVYLFKGELDLALEYYHKSLMMSEKHEFVPLISKLLNNIGQIYWQKGNLDLALEYYHKSLPLLHKLGNKQHLAILLSNIGLIFWNRGELNFALDYYQSSLSLFEELDSKLEMANVYNNIGLLYKDKGELDLALDYFQVSLTIRLELENKQQIASSFNNIGIVYYSKGNSRIANSYYQRSLELFDEIGNNLGTIDPLYNLIIQAISNNSIEEAQRYLLKLQEINEKEDNKIIDQSYTLAKALILKTSDRMAKKAEAQQIFQQFTDQKGVKFEIKVEAMTNLCELLLLELKNTGSGEVLRELKALLDQLVVLAKTQYSHLWLTNTYILQSKLALLELNIKSAQELLNRAQLIAEEKGLRSLELTIKQERNLLVSQLNRWENIFDQKPSMSEVIELTNLYNLVERMVHKRLFYDEEDINKYAKEAQRMLAKWEKDGFDDEKPLSENP